LAHQADNQSPPFAGHNAYRSDPLLKDIAADMPRGLRTDFETVGKFTLASAEAQDLARIANRAVPELRTHDGFGNRIDQVDFHPSWHALMRRSGVAIGLAGLGLGRPARRGGLRPPGPRHPVLPHRWAGKRPSVPADHDQCLDCGDHGLAADRKGLGAAGGFAAL
jgi:hypothetical protein